MRRRPDPGSGELRWWCLVHPGGRRLSADELKAVEERARTAQRAARARPAVPEVLRAAHEQEAQVMPVETPRPWDPAVVPTDDQLLDWMLSATRAEQLELLGSVRRRAADGWSCVARNHAGRLKELLAVVADQQRRIDAAQQPVVPVKAKRVLSPAGREAVLRNAAKARAAAAANRQARLEQQQAG